VVKKWDHFSATVTVVKAIWQQGHITATHGQFNRIRQMAPMCTPPNTDSLEPLESTSKMVSGSVQPFLHSSRQSIPILYNGPPLPRQNCSFRLGIWTHLIHTSLDQNESTTQTTCSSIQPFFAQFTAESPYALQWGMSLPSENSSFA